MVLSFFLLSRLWIHPYLLSFYGKFYNLSHFLPLPWSLVRQTWNQNYFFLCFLTSPFFQGLGWLWNNWVTKTFWLSCSNPAPTSQAICSLMPSDTAAYPDLAGEGLHSFLSAQHTLTSWSFFNLVSGWSTSAFCKSCPFLIFTQAFFQAQSIILFPKYIAG